MSEPTVQTASEPVILTEKKGYIGYIILNRPKKLNAINWQVYREMIPAIEKMETDDDVKVVVLKGAGRCFSAGFDLSEPSFDDHEENRRMYERVAHRARWKLWSLPKPTIAQIHKFCLGGAHETMMACDMAICSDDTTFGIPEIKFGQGSCFPILPYSMTLRKARELILTGENYDAKTALEYGVVNYSVPMEELDAFLGGLSAVGKPVNLVKTEEDLTQRYSEVNARLTTLTAQRDQYNQLIEQAASAEEIETLAGNAQSAQEQIDTLEAAIREWDTACEYATVNLSLSTQAAAVAGASDDGTLGARMGTAFSQALDFLQDMLVSLAYLAPAILSVAIVAIAVALVRKSRKNHKGGETT